MYLLADERKATHNSTLAIGGVSSPLDIPIAIGIVIAESSVLRTKFCAENPAHRQSANRWESLFKNQDFQSLTII